MPFPSNPETYQLIKNENGLELYQCVNCGNTRADEDCILRVQRTCSQLGWNAGWCQQREEESKGVVNGD